MSSILRGARCGALAARLSQNNQVRPIRALSISAVVGDKLPTTNWGSSGSPAPSSCAPASTSSAPPKARDWGTGSGGAAPAARNWGSDNRNKGRDDNRNNSRNRDGGGGGQDRRGPRHQNGQGGQNRQSGQNGQNRQNRQDRQDRTQDQNVNQNRSRENRPRRDEDGSWGVRKGAPSQGQGQAQGGARRSGGAPAQAQASDRSSRADSLANERWGVSPPRSERDAGDRGDRGGGRPARGHGNEEGDRHSRRRQSSQEHSSRSLLHTSEGDQLPGSRHHSDRGHGKAAKGKGRAGERVWVTNDDAALAAARDEFLRQQAEKERRAAERAAKEAAAKKKKAAVERDVFIPDTISVAQLAEKFGIKAVWLMRKMKGIGMEDIQCRPGYILNSEDASNLALEYNLNPIIDQEKAFDIYPEHESEAELAECPLRPPVVTIMGHVDHGKTTLLDSLRKTSVAAGEAGGITQHIAAFSVPLNSILPADAPQTDATITFLDTPGHAAFTGMRARGASVTDLVVLVVAADDGVMPQTKEVIELVKRAGDTVGLVVAINKCDKPNIDVERVKSGLGAESILLEEDGGEVPSVRVSGLTGLGIDDLVETLSTLAEVRDLRARKTGKAEGFVLESHVDKGQGVVSTVLVSRGILRSGAAVVAGNTWARVRTMYDSTGQEVTEVGPGTPVTVTGWREVPVAGDVMLEAVKGEEEAKKAIDNRLRDQERKALVREGEIINAKREEERLRAATEALDIAQAKEAGKNVAQLLAQQRRAADAVKAAGKKELRLLIKGDVSGTVEAVVGSLAPIGNAEAGVKVIHTGVGDVTESDIMHAEASEATVIGFNVECPRSIMTLANMSEVPVHVDSVIYRLIDTVRGQVSALLPPAIEYRITGEATVQQIFEIKKGKDVHVIAGCKVNNGVISRAEPVRVLRGPNRAVVHEGTMETLKHVKKDVAEMRKGTECGIAVTNFKNIQVGDEIVSFNKVEVPRTL